MKRRTPMNNTLVDFGDDNLSFMEWSDFIEDLSERIANHDPRPAEVYRLERVDLDKLVSEIEDHLQSESSHRDFYSSPEYSGRA
jgi:hypothetical protein